MIIVDDIWSKLRDLHGRHPFDEEFIPVALPYNSVDEMAEPAKLVEEPANEPDLPPMPQGPHDEMVFVY